MSTGFIGIGSMGSMLVRGFLRSGALLPQDVFAASRSQPKLDRLLADCPGIHVVSSSELAAQCGVIFVCVGATDLAAVLASIEPKLNSEQLLITTSAAVPLKTLEDRVPCCAAKLIPSITQEIGAGISLLIYGSRVRPENRHLLEELLGHISHPIVIPESLTRPAVGLTSGGPALIAYLFQAIADAAARSNREMPPELARKLVDETASATMKLFTEAGMGWEEIIRRVAVPGGMTEFSMEILSRSVPLAWQTMFQEAAARERKSRESLVL